MHKICITLTSLTLKETTSKADIQEFYYGGNTSPSITSKLVQQPHQHQTKQILIHAHNRNLRRLWSLQTQDDS
jgi:ABC-type antimicrobial peptide transport system ATPase subunit